MTKQNYFLTFSAAVAATCSVFFLAFLLLMPVAVVTGIDNGLGLTPPMGWRSWNLYGKNVNQSAMERIMDAMVSRERTVDGVPTSLCDLGYCDVGLDDNWYVFLMI